MREREGGGGVVTSGEERNVTKISVQIKATFL